MTHPAADPKHDVSRPRHPLWWLPLPFLVVLVVWLGSWWGTERQIGQWSDRASFGDMFGAVNALFAGLAFAGVVCALLLQQRQITQQLEELALQREELNLSRMEMARQARAQEEQAASSEQTLVEMRDARRAESKPYVVAYFDAPYGGRFVHLVIRNVGRTEARDVVVTFDPSIQGTVAQDQGLPLPNFVTAPIPFMAPDFELRSVLWRSDSLSEKTSAQGVPTLYRAHIAYQDVRPPQSSHEAYYMLDATAFFNRLSETAGSLRDVEKAIDKNTRVHARSTQAMRNIASAAHRLLPEPSKVDSDQIWQAPLPPPE